MKLKTEWGSLSLDEIQHEIDVRENLVPHMDGNLYPKVLIDEIDELIALKEKKIIHVRIEKV